MPLPAPVDDRPLGRALRRGFFGACPNCGRGRLLQGYLRLRPTCPVCGEDLSHARADDGPAYLTILVVGHIVAPTLLAVFVHWRPSPLLLMTFFAVAAVSLSLALLPRFKGMMVGIQWSRRMHGFGKAESHHV
ncbi:DUF983 domain-containing protein [Phaeovulum sp.]|uniref:DUF983 domain-containing protein n=1 Tax=Phaeovulum sp. TaxID=2934796 RepID=UPI0027300565|nr:DUF983 domain-containing protein [Phaeovulum sp.]MDP1667424.1 DUF983 domain-containing protein [Phaeovulum sp.]MDP2064317.1 DUF983 domain-containing protein [Phaeovulum sp.]MDP3862544.1 DUF983 domain-containing protein [Phaeovulum sp.]MDZ4119941.1 DUF983 domain-containing protein [Phaeovulum sp.]